MIVRFLCERKEMPRPKSLGHLRIVAVVLLLMWFMGVPAGLFAQPAEKTDIKQYDIAPGPLGPALEYFSRGSGINIFYDDALINGIRAKGLQGLYSVETGLETLLEDTGIIALNHSGGWILKSETASVASNRQSEVLDQTDNMPESDASQNNVEMPALVVRDISEKETISL